MRRVLTLALLAAAVLAAAGPVSLVTAGKAEAARSMKPTGDSTAAHATRRGR